MFRRLEDAGDATAGALGEHRRWFVVIGVTSVLLGIVAILLPFVAGLVTAIAIGWLMVIAGLMEGYRAIRSPRARGAGWEIAIAVVHVVGGVLVVAFPVAGKLALTLILAWYFIAEGFLKLVRSTQHRGAQAAGWLVVDGILSLVLGILILVHWPAVAVWVFGVFVGVSLVMRGASMLIIGLGAGREAPV
jgi:uncharacterized membrane protein HdeD (DUF308 family)